MGSKFSSFINILKCMNVFDSKNQIDIITPKQEIEDIFIKPTNLKNDELIEYKGIINDNKYYLFEHDKKKYYIKISNEGFGICKNLEELNQPDFYIGHITKIPSREKLLRSLQMQKTLDKSIYILDGGLEISHINSTYIHSSEENMSSYDKLKKSKVLTFEYLLVYENIYTVLSYNHIYDLSLLSKKIKLE